MKEYPAKRLIAANNAFSHCHGLFIDDSDMTPAVREKMASALRVLIRESENLNLRLTKVHAERVVNGLGAWSADEIERLLGELEERFHDELESMAFLFVPAERLHYYKQQRPFGELVAANFPDADYDISEAYNCYAVGRFTAAVFHCMRVLEHGLSVLAQKFNVPFEHKTWNGIIEPIEKAIRDIKSAKKKPRNWKKDEQFYSEAAAQFMHFKNAWRNYTAHKQFIYTEEQAEAILRHVQDFMTHLAARLKQRGRRTV